MVKGFLKTLWETVLPIVLFPVGLCLSLLFLSDGIGRSWNAGHMSRWHFILFNTIHLVAVGAFSHICFKSGSEGRSDQLGEEPKESLKFVATIAFGLAGFLMACLYAVSTMVWPIILLAAISYTYGFYGYVYSEKRRIKWQANADWNERIMADATRRAELRATDQNLREHDPCEDHPPTNTDANPAPGSTPAD